MSKWNASITKWVWQTTFVQTDSTWLNNVHRDMECKPSDNYCMQWWQTAQYGVCLFTSSFVYSVCSFVLSTNFSFNSAVAIAVHFIMFDQFFFFEIIFFFLIVEKNVYFWLNFFFIGIMFFECKWHFGLKVRLFSLAWKNIFEYQFWTKFQGNG